MIGRKRLKLPSSKRGAARSASGDKQKELNDLIEKALKKGSNRFIAELMKLEGKEFVDRYSALFEYVKPKLSRVEGENDTDKGITLNFISAGDSKKMNQIAPKNQEDGDYIELK
jgi:hypothetical protein